MVRLLSALLVGALIHANAKHPKFMDLLYHLNITISLLANKRRTSIELRPLRYGLRCQLQLGSGLHLSHGASTWAGAELQPAQIGATGADADDALGARLQKTFAVRYGRLFSNTPQSLWTLQHRLHQLPLAC